MKVLPLIKKLNRTIVPVGNEETGILYFEKRHHRTVGEREALDSTELKQNKGQFLLVKLAGKIAENKGIKVADAYNYIFPSEDQQIDEDFNVMLEYPEEMQELMALRSQTNRLKDEVATVLISGRVAYPVKLAANAGFNSTTLAVEPLAFNLKQGDRLKFGKCVVELTANYLADCEAISVTPISENLPAETVGFLVDFATGKEKLGNAEWTLEDTKVLPETLTEEIYAFYQRESAGLSETEVKAEDEKNDQTPVTTNSLTPSTESAESSLPTGSDSTSDVKVTE